MGRVVPALPVPAQSVESGRPTVKAAVADVTVPVESRTPSETVLASPTAP